MMTAILDETTYASAAMKQMCKELAPFVHSADPILFCGETGSGMGFFARALHQASRGAGEYIMVPCFSLDEATVQQQFLGANDEPGWVEKANNGTIFLKRLSEASLVAQQTVLHLLTNQSSGGKLEFSRKGRTETLHVDVRFLCSVATEVNTAVQEGLLRRDVVSEIRKFGKIIHLPPLRERKEDFPILLEQLLEELNAQYDRHVASIHKQALKHFLTYKWPGNVRELRRVLTRIYSQYPEITQIGPDHLPDSIVKPEASGGEYFFQLKDKERFHGRFLTPSLRVKRDSSKFRVHTVNIVEILRVEDTRFAPPKLKHFEIKLRDGSQLAGMILDKTIEVETSFNAVHRITLQDVDAVVAI